MTRTAFSARSASASNVRYPTRKRILICPFPPPAPSGLCRKGLLSVGMKSDMYFFYDRAIMDSLDADEAIWKTLQEALMTMTSTTKADHKDEVKPGRHRRAHLSMTVNTEGSDTFRSLPMKERERILEEFRAAFAPAFSNMTVDEYIAQRRKEAAREA